MSDIVSDIKSLMPATVQHRRWFQPEDKQQAEMIRIIADAWVAGEFGTVARHVAPAISQRLAESGVHVKPNTVREWLTSLKRS
jgi:hypothetical protein